MPLLGFSKLKDKLLNGSKTQTIRKPRKRPFKLGDKLYIYWHLRQRDCEKLGEGIVTKLQRKCIANMTNTDALLDGFDNTLRGSALHNLALAFKQLHPEGNEWTDYDIITWKWTSTTFQLL